MCKRIAALGLGNPFGCRLQPVICAVKEADAGHLRLLFPTALDA
jgi:hypothetical protein